MLTWRFPKIRWRSWVSGTPSSSEARSSSRARTTWPPTWSSEENETRLLLFFLFFERNKPLCCQTKYPSHSKFKRKLNEPLYLSKNIPNPSVKFCLKENEKGHCGTKKVLSHKTICNLLNDFAKKESKQLNVEMQFFASSQKWNNLRNSGFWSPVPFFCF